MKKYFKGSLFALVFTLSGSINIAQSQPVYKIIDTKDVNMKLLGTSTLHKWEMDTKTVQGDAQFEISAENKLVSLNSLSFALEVKDLKSDSKGLDKNAYKALKSDEYKHIHYKLLSAIVTPENKGSYLLKTNGNLTIAGVTKEIKMDVFCVINEDATITCTGSDKLKMTDYKVKPPSFMLGAMKTGDDITLDFVVIYKKQKGA